MLTEYFGHGTTVIQCDTITGSTIIPIRYFLVVKEQHHGKFISVLQ